MTVVLANDYVVGIVVRATPKRPGDGRLRRSY